MRKMVGLLLILALISGCGTKHLIVDKTDGINKYESRIIAVEYMGGMEPSNFRDCYDSWRWSFKIKRPGYVPTQKYIHVNKMTGEITEAPE